MTRVIDRRKAIYFRQQGKTYSEIKKELNLSKSTLSGWLSKYPLTREQLEKVKSRINFKKNLAVEKCRLTKLNKWKNRLKQTYENEKNRLLNLTEKELYIAGLFLYWGEGSKAIKNAISLNNTDPKVVKFYLFWLTKILHFDRNKIRVQVHLYDDMNIKRSLDYWSRELRMPMNQFARPYIKKSKRIEVDQKGFGHGTCTLRIGNVLLKEKILMGIEAIADHYNQKI
ncbi:MAG: helix-turn-helix domain-containing protein [Candidatus Shapirobacteria bacterium]